MIQKFGSENENEHFADTRDTLCYATNENQEATYGLLKQDADLAIVVGGYNSSNTSHIVELCEQKLPTYFISSEKEIESATTINHFDFDSSRSYFGLKSKMNLKPKIKRIPHNIMAETSWYVLRAVSGQEKKIRTYLENEIARQSLEEYIPQIVIPTEKIFELRNGVRRAGHTGLAFAVVAEAGYFQDCR